jgi:GlpG protein
MRQLTTLPSADVAQTFADYLLTQRIETKLEREADGWAVWVRDEDQMPRARQELEEFNRNPQDPRFKAATSTATTLRRQKVKVEQAYHRRQDRFAARMSGGFSAYPVTVSLIVTCALVSLFSEGGNHLTPLVQDLSISPYLVQVQELSEGGEEVIGWRRIDPGMKPILQGQIWRLLTPIFIHIGFLHLVFNMYWLYILGGAIERRRGRFRYLSLIVVTAVLSNLAQYFLGHVDWSVSPPRLVFSPAFGGMSGVVYGLFGYVWMKARFQPELGLGIHPNTVIFMMAWLVLCMTPAIHYIIGSGVANAAHVAGLIVGMLIGYVPALWSSGRSG